MRKKSFSGYITSDISVIVTNPMEDIEDAELPTLFDIILNEFEECGRKIQSMDVMDDQMELKMSLKRHIRGVICSEDPVWDEDGGDPGYEDVEWKHEDGLEESKLVIAVKKGLIAHNSKFSGAEVNVNMEDDENTLCIE